MQILTLCGSLRKPSSNSALVQALESLLPTVRWIHFPIRELPYFDPELQFSEELPHPVKELRLIAQNSAALVVSTPEYAHGIPGILKNALEWLVCEETMQKPVGILVASPSGGEYVTPYLTETLRTMDLRPNPELTLVTRHARQQLSEDGKILDDALRADLQRIATALQKELS